MTIRIRHHDRTCPECRGEGFVVLEPVNPGGARVSGRCDCQPPETETDREYYTRLGHQDAAALDVAMDKANDWRDTFTRDRGNRE